MTHEQLLDAIRLEFSAFREDRMPSGRIWVDIEIGEKFVVVELAPDDIGVSLCEPDDSTNFTGHDRVFHDPTVALDYIRSLVRAAANAQATE